jgi:hypothetical protein
MGAAAAKKVNEEFFARLWKITPPKEGISLEEYINNRLVMYKITGVDPVYPKLFKENREIVKQNAIMEYKRNGIDYDGAGRVKTARFSPSTLLMNSRSRHWNQSKSQQLCSMGLYDSIIPVEMGRQLASKIPGCRIVEYVGNHSIGNHPDVLNFNINAITDHNLRYSNKKKNAYIIN